MEVNALQRQCRAWLRRLPTKWRGHPRTPRLETTHPGPAGPQPTDGDMDLQAMRQECETRLRGFPLPVPLTGQSFCATLAKRRRRSIVLCPMPMRPGPSGLWLADDYTDYILYERDTSPIHQQLIIFHEASHIFCGHRPARVLAGSLGMGPFPGLDLERMQAVMPRHAYSTREEWEAELTGTDLLIRSGLATHRAALPSPPPAAATDPAITTLVERLAASLEADEDELPRR